MVRKGNSPLPDGLLIRQDNDLRHQAGQWSTIVVFEAPDHDDRYRGLLNCLRRAIGSYETASNGTTKLWLQRWSDLMALTKSVCLIPVAKEVHRKRRGLIDAGVICRRNYLVS